jgi:hypothetical protein
MGLPFVGKRKHQSSHARLDPAVVSPRSGRRTPCKALSLGPCKSGSDRPEVATARIPAVWTGCSQIFVFLQLSEDVKILIPFSSNSHRHPLQCAKKPTIWEEVK